jgi:hypothetical protein
MSILQNFKIKFFFFILIPFFFYINLKYINILQTQNLATFNNIYFLEYTFIEILWISFILVLLIKIALNYNNLKKNFFWMQYKYLTNFFWLSFFLITGSFFSYIYLYEKLQFNIKLKITSWNFSLSNWNLLFNNYFILDFYTLLIKVLLSFSILVLICINLTYFLTFDFKNKNIIEYPILFSFSVLFMLSLNYFIIKE